MIDALRASGLPVFNTTIPRRIAAEDQVSDRLVASDPEANFALSEAYLAFAEEVLTRMGVPHGR